MRRLAIGALVLGAVLLVAAIAATILLTRGSEKSVAAPEETATPTLTASIGGRVIDTTGNTIAGALVRVSGPFRSKEAASNYEQLTNAGGFYWIGLPIDGEYDISASADGYELSLLISGQNVGEVKGLFGVPDIILKKKTEVTQQRGTDAYVYGKGVQKSDVCRVVMDHGLITSCDEINEPTAVNKSGSGWTTYIRDGQAITTKPANYDNEPFWEVTFKSDRLDGLKVVYVQRKCGNVSAPPGEKIPPPRREVMLPTPTKTPVGPSPTPPATNTPCPTRTPVPPTASPPPPPTQTAQPRPTEVPPCPDCLPPPTYESPPPTWEATATSAPIWNPTPTVAPPGPTSTYRPPPNPTPLP